jgi:hypothetical protein
MKRRLCPLSSVTSPLGISNIYNLPDNELKSLRAGAICLVSRPCKLFLVAVLWSSLWTPANCICNAGWSRNNGGPCRVTRTIKIDVPASKLSTFSLFIEIDSTVLDLGQGWAENSTIYSMRGGNGYTSVKLIGSKWKYQNDMVRNWTHIFSNDYPRVFVVDNQGTTPQTISFSGYAPELPDRKQQSKGISWLYFPYEHTINLSSLTFSNISNGDYVYHLVPYYSDESLVHSGWVYHDMHWFSWSNQINCSATPCTLKNGTAYVVNRKYAGYVHYPDFFNT